MKKARLFEERKLNQANQILSRPRLGAIKFKRSRQLFTFWTCFDIQNTFADYITGS